MADMKIDVATQFNKPDGVTIDVDSEGALYAKTATGGTLGKPGIVKPDNATITNNQGSISARIASSSSTGVVQPDATTTKVTTTGILSAMTAWPTGTRQTITAPTWTSYSSSLSQAETQWSCNVNGWFRARIQQDSGSSIKVDLRLLVYTADGSYIILEQAANSWIGTASILRTPSCVSVPVPARYIVYLLAFAEATSNQPVITCYFTPSVS
jgi:hypothetical protein